MDLQNDIVSAEGKLGRLGLAAQADKRRVLDHAQTALHGFREHKDYVVHVRLAFRPDYLDALSIAPRVAKLKELGAAQAGTWGTEFLSSVAPLDGELILNKQCVNPFYNTGLAAWLACNSIRELVLAGVSTNAVVESAARYADDAGYSVVVLEDCCSASSDEMHDFAVNKTLPMFARVTTTKEYLRALEAAR